MGEFQFQLHVLHLDVRPQVLAHGRLDVVRALLDAGAEFAMAEPHWGADRVIEANPGAPSFAPPALRKGNFTVAQTPAILHYLGETLAGGAYRAGGGAEGSAVHLQLLLDIGDVTSELFTEVRKGAEARAAFASAEDGSRLKNWLLHLGKIYQRHAGGGDGGGFLFGQAAPTAADFFMLSALEPFEFVYGAPCVAGLLPQSFVPWRAALQARPFFAAYQAQAKPPLFGSMKHAE